MKSVVALAATAVLLGCAGPKPSGKPAGDSAKTVPPGSEVSSSGVETSSESCRLIWRLPAGRKLRYAHTTTTWGIGGRAMKKGSITLNVDIIAAEDGLALVDHSLKVGGNSAFDWVPAEQFKLRYVLDAEKGFEPVGTISYTQSSGSHAIFPLSYTVTRIGEEWPFDVKTISWGTSVSVEGSSVAMLESITGEPGARIAKIALRSAIEQVISESEGGVVEPVRMNVSGTGSAEFDLFAGYFKSSAFSMSIALPTTPLSGGPVLNDMEMKMMSEMKLVEVGMVDAEELARASKVLATRKAVAEAVKLAAQGKNAEALAVLSDGPLGVGIAEEHAHLVTAQIHARMGNWREAKAAIEKELDLCPGYLQAIQVAGVVYLRSGDKDKAEEMRKKLRDLMKAPR